jgi:cell division protein FtsB
LINEYKIVIGAESAGGAVQGHDPAKDGIVAGLLAAQTIAPRTGGSPLRRIRIGQVLGGAVLSRVINSYWVDERIRAQRVVPRGGQPFASVREISVGIIGSPAEVRKRGGVVPAWVIFGMIILATVAICVAVTLRTSTKMSLASEQYVRMQTDVQTLRDSNQSLRLEIEQLQTDPRAIEAAARSRLNMVRANEIVIPVE